MISHPSLIDNTMSTLREIDDYYLRKDEPAKSCLQALRLYLLSYNPHITEAWKYRMPFFLYKGKMFCYLWTEHNNNRPYLGIVKGGNIDHPRLIQGERSRMKILPIDPARDLPLTTINTILKKALVLYR